MTVHIKSEITKRKRFCTVTCSKTYIKNNLIRFLDLIVTSDRMRGPRHKPTTIDKL